MNKRLPLLALFAGLLTFPLPAQVAGTITGSVSDPAGAAVAGAKIDLYLEAA